ncbi:site-specific integrase [Alistipes putredinis]|uniref:site-specific integrase n=1 Tax=Alistipes putredinis TaxID=28117 RepID=UPI002FD8D7FA
MKVEKFKVLLYLKRSGLDKSGKAPIMGRITVNRTMAQFSSKLSCTPELWNPRESRLNGKSKEAVEINAKIDKLLLAINLAFDSLLERKIDFDATAVKEAFQGSVETQMTLLRRLDIHIEDMQSRIGIDVAKSSMSTYIYTRRYLGEFIKKRFKVEDLAFGQLNEHLAYEFQEYVLKDKGLAVDTARHYLAILKKICRLAFKEGHSEKRYFVNFKLPKENRKAPRALSREDFEKIRDLEIPASRVTHNIARDLFLFACYTGVPYADAVSITDDNIYTDDNGALWLKYLRKKNEHLGRVKLLPEAIALIEKYRSNERKELFPMIHHPNLRRHMKGLRDLAGIKTDLVYHQSRHTFGTLLVSAGVPMESIAKMMGHTNIRTTQGYAKVTDDKISEDMDRLMEKRNSMVQV